MAARPPAWENVLDEADDATAALIVEMQLEDARTLVPGDTAPDFDVARTQYANELRIYRGGRRFDIPASSPGAILVHCIICEDQFDRDRCCQTPCQHYFCGECLDNLFRTAMTDEQVYPPRCCDQTVYLEAARDLLNRELAEEFASKKEELDDTKRTYCHVSTCSTYIGQQHRAENIATCPTCKLETCIPCKSARHEGDCTQDEALEETLRLASTEGWQTCPNCDRVVDLQAGCFHITCLCKEEFCYVCAARWKSCGCPQFDEDRLLDRGREIADREGRDDLEAVINNLRENHGCIEHDWNWLRGVHDCDTCHRSCPTFVYRCRTCQRQTCRRCRYTRL